MVDTKQITDWLRTPWGLALIVIVLVGASVGATLGVGEWVEDDENEGDLEITWTLIDIADEDPSDFSSTGETEFFVLQPGFQIVLEGKDSELEGTVRVEITVLDETKMIGGFETRIVVEDETIDGEQLEISYNYFAIHDPTGTVFYFGEDVDNYENGVVCDHGGTWIAFEGDNLPGVMMPGRNIFIGSQYYLEYAPDVAMEGARIESLSAEVSSDVGTFTNCIKVAEYNLLECNNEGESYEYKDLEAEYKYYAAGIGLIVDSGFRVISYGYLP